MLDLAIRGPIARADLPGLAARACALLENAEGETIRCEVAEVAADAAALEALARLALAARRRGCHVVLRGASEQLRALVALTGLADVLPGEPTRRDAAEARTAGTAWRSRGRT